MRPHHSWLVSCAVAIGLSSCAGVELHVRQTTASLETAALVITEVAQSTDYGGTTTDKVEVYCTTATGCSSFKVCDSGSQLLSDTGCARRAHPSRNLARIIHHEFGSGLARERERRGTPRYARGSVPMYCRAIRSPG